MGRPRIDPKVKAANKKDWEVRNFKRRKLYFHKRYLLRIADPVQLKMIRDRARRYYQVNKPRFRAYHRTYANKHKEAIKVSRNLNITMKEARVLLASIPLRRLSLFCQSAIQA